MKSPIEHAREEQKRCADYVISDGPDQQGARLGLHDWFAEEYLMIYEGRFTDEKITLDDAK